MEISHIIILVLSVVCASLLMKVFLRKDTARAARHRGASQMAGSLRAYGLKRLPAILDDYALSDWQGMGHKMQEIAALFLQGEDPVKNELNETFKSVLKVTVQTEEGRAFVKSVLEDAASVAAVALPVARKVADLAKVAAATAA